MEVRDRIAALRQQMRRRKLSAYLVPSTDAHQSEYLPECYQRRPWISGFTGSAGDVVVTLRRAGLWTDGRYFLQAEAQLAGSGIELFRLGEKGTLTIEEFLASTLRKGQKAGCDSRVLSVARAASLQSSVEKAGARFQFLSTNLVDAIWKDQPPRPKDALRLQPTKFAGESRARRLARVRQVMAQVGCRAHVLSALDTIMWALNVRGRDVAFNPVAISYLVIEPRRATLYVDLEKITPSVGKALRKVVRLRPYEEAAVGLKDLAHRKQKVWIDTGTASRWILDQLRGAKVHAAPSPIVAMKACKNPVEMQGMRDAHRRDGVAMVRFLKWLEENVGDGNLTEISASDKLEEFRTEGQFFQGLSFDTISGYAAHGAIIHYSATPQTQARLRPKGIYLLDSGAQYLDGTTDITRTVLLGEKATRKQVDRYTRVLQGHIDLAMVRFPSGVRGMRLDTLARIPLWQAGLDYQHGTGHGVGAHLNVHEGPQSIGPRCTGAALEVGNVLSNEPGYYEPGAFGIRIENLVMVVEDEKLSKNGQRWHRFENLTLCPIDTRLVRVDMLSADQRKWVNDYHKRVKKELSPQLDTVHRRWLSQRCRTI
jgi:Xaa-Pro aminopeptidase